MEKFRLTDAEETDVDDFNCDTTFAKPRTDGRLGSLHQLCSAVFSNCIPFK